MTDHIRPQSAPTPDSFAPAAERLAKQRPLKNPQLRRIDNDLDGDRLDQSESALAGYLAKRPNDADAIYLLARIHLRRGHREQAAMELARCLDRAPDFAAARFNYASLLLKLGRFRAALQETDELQRQDGSNPIFLQLKADILETMGDSVQAVAICERLASENPGRAESWMNYGHMLRATGQPGQAIAAYRRAIDCRPSFGLAYWGLANIKSFVFHNADIEAMMQQLGRTDLPDSDRAPLQFALGKAYEHVRAFEKSFEQYARANAAMRLRMPYDADAMTRLVNETKAVLTSEFIDSRVRAGCRAPDPIFVLSLPRSGSTLVEQMLSCHTSIEATGELPHLPAIVRHIEEVAASSGSSYPGFLKNFEPSALRTLGEEYLERVEVHRKTDRPFFVDKQPRNWLEVGLLRLILPNAKIVEVRRHPVASSLSVFKHYFNMTRPRLSELGRLYLEYVALMSHFDSVLPGAIHHVVYENLVANPEIELRKLLSFLGLPFEEDCLRFFESKRTVLTPSAEQVRRPITRDAVDHWRNYEPWLGPLLASLGPAAELYPSTTAST